MQKALFISDETPFSFNHSGASSFKTSHLALLNEMKTLHVYLLCFPGKPGVDNSIKMEIPNLDFQKITFLHADFELTDGSLSLSKMLLSLVPRINSFRRDSSVFHSVNSKNLSVLQNLINEITPDLIWAEHLEPFLLASYLPGLKCKIIYSHHDFLWKLIVIRRQKLKDFIRSFLYRKIQTSAISRSGHYVVSGAGNELEEIRKINKRSSTLYLPTLYPFIPIAFPVVPAWNQPLRIVHFGCSRATANRIGIRNLLLHILPKLRSKIDFECHIIGDTDRYDPELRDLLDQPDVVCKGYAPDLSDVLFPLDIHILPYDKATGSRTRYAVAVNYGQVLLAHQAAVAGIEGLIHNQNCLIENSFEGLADAILHLCETPPERTRLAVHAKAWYEETHQLTRYAGILKQWFSQNNILHD